MNSRKIISAILVSLLMVSIFSATATCVMINASQDLDDPETLVKKAQVVFTVDPDGAAKVDGRYEGDPPEDFFGMKGVSMNVSVVFTENGAVKSIQIKLPPEVASEFPLNSSTVSLLVDFLSGLTTTNLNATVVLPTDVASQFPFNATDLTVSGEYLDGDLDILIDCAMEVNLTEVLSSIFGMFAGFDQTYEFPMFVQLDYSKGEYEGLIVLHLLAGFPIGDVEADVAGNLTDVRLNGTVTVIYGTFGELVMNQTIMDQLEDYAETTFNASIDTEGSLLNMTEGKLNCTYINIERKNISGGEEVTFEVRIHGDFVSLLASQLKLALPDMDNGDINLVYNLLNDTLYKIQSASIDIAYMDTMLYFTLTGTLHLEDLVKQVSETITSDQWHLPIGEGPFYIDSLLLLINSTIHSIQNATVELTYEREEGTVNVSLAFVMNPEEASSGIVGSLEEIMWAFPPEIVEIIKSLLTNRFAEIVSARYQLTYAKGFVNYTDDELYEGDINAQVNFMKSLLLLQYLEAASPNGLPWQAYYVNETLIEITGLGLWVSMNETSMTLEFEDLTLQPPIDVVNATTFKLERFFNLTSEDFEFPGENETLSVTVIGGSNSTHKIVLYNATDIPQPDIVLKDALNRVVLMAWNNVTLTSIKDIQFIIVPGAQSGIVIPEPEKVTAERPVTINATKTMGVFINITRVSDSISIVVSNVTAPEGVKPPPGTWKVLGKYIQISVSNVSASVNATIRMYYTDEQVTATGVAESSLKIHRWNGTDWEPIEPSYVNTAQNYVWAYVDHFSIYALMGDVPPTAVTLTISDITENSLKLTWTNNTDPDFARFEIFQSTIEGQLGTSIANITSRATLSRTVSGLSPGTKYYFTVRVWDTVGLHTDSQKISATTLLPIWQQPWFIGSIVAVIVVVAVAAAVLMKRKGPSGTA